MQSLTGLLFASCVGVALAIPEPIRLDFAKGPVAPELMELLRRDNTVDVTLLNRESHQRYLANVTVGTPGQPFQLVVDTGSSDMWVPYAQSSLCKSQDGCVFGQFKPQDSSTFVEFGAYGDFNISYDSADTGETGYYFNDTVNIAGIDIPNFTIGLAVDDSIGQGLLGIGFQNLESVAQNTNFSVAFNTVNDWMLDLGYIERVAYSLYLNSITADSGSLLFGGVDSAKYTGDLVALPIQPDTASGYDNLYDRFLVTLTSISFTDATGASTQLTDSSMASAALLDSGTPLLTVPGDVATALFNGLGASVVDSQTTVVPCRYANSPATLNFQFGGSDGPQIAVPMSALIFKGDFTDQDEFSNGDAACLLGIQSTESVLDGSLILGDTFLRSAYLVYDLQNQVIAIAQAKYTSDSNVQAIPSGTSIPGVSSTATAVATLAAVPTAAVSTAAAATSAAISVPNEVSPTFSLGAAISASPTGAAASDGVYGTGSAAATSSSVAGSAMLHHVSGSWYEGKGAMGATLALGLVSLVCSFVL